MGEMADYIIENGQQEYWYHINDDCEGWCPYCEEEDDD